MGNITYSLYDYLHCSNVLGGMKVYIDVVGKIRRVYIYVYRQNIKGVKFTLELSTKPRRESRGMALFFL